MITKTCSRPGSPAADALRYLKIMNRDDIIKSLNEMRDVCACSLRFIATKHLADDFCELLDITMPWLKKGFGIRCQDLIDRLEKGEEINQITNHST